MRGRRRLYKIQALNPSLHQPAGQRSSPDIIGKIAIEYDPPPQSAEDIGRRRTASAQHCFDWPRKQLYIGAPAISSGYIVQRDIPN
jgi:hypothetical protein